MSRSKKSAGSKRGLALARHIRTPWDTAGYAEIVYAILGKDYELSLVLIGDTRAKTLNMRWRNKPTPANVLSFPLSPKSGEIFINIPRVKREARRFGFSPRAHAAYLLIHGCLHLKGYRHGSTMERAERAHIARFNLRTLR